MEARKKEQTEYIEKLKKSVAKSDQATVLNNDVVKDVVIEILAEGNGDKPTRNDIVKVHYEGKLIDGTIFDSSIKRNQPAEFPLTGVIPCWTEAFQLLKKGAKARLTCPSDTAYGSNDMGTIPPYSTLIFEVELLDIIKK
ncbi:MAG: FKBP-type peptidyl-prolyl cis-trans isomerase [Elusimicrobiaceae bacterium]|nr:FKBP-type peptidyl-prolyl cis-trans isomerase [Elusimicrobiaceae bacterium]MBT5987676.1 FKBP-type peptidyl-prolyl cis-trans isomerase [Elusimicrobiaceae bacterium]